MSPFSLNRQQIRTLYEFHEPSNLSYKEFIQYVRNFPVEDVRELWDAMIQDRRKITGPTTPPKIRPVTLEIEASIDFKQLYNEFGRAHGWSRQDFRNIIQLASSEDLQELINSLKDEGKSSIQQRSIKHTGNDGHLLASLSTVYRVKKATARKPSGLTERSSTTFPGAPIGLAESALKSSVRSYSRRHPLFINAAPDQGRKQIDNYLSDIYNYARGRGLDHHSAITCKEEAQSQHRIICQWLALQPTSSEATILDKEQSLGNMRHNVEGRPSPQEPEGGSREVPKPQNGKRKRHSKDDGNDDCNAENTALVVEEGAIIKIPEASSDDVIQTSTQMSSFNAIETMELLSGPTKTIEDKKPEEYKENCVSFLDIDDNVDGDLPNPVLAEGNRQTPYFTCSRQETVPSGEEEMKREIPTYETNENSNPDTKIAPAGEEDGLTHDPNTPETSKAVTAQEYLFVTDDSAAV